MADTRDLKSLAYKAYEFESRWRHQKQEVLFSENFLLFLENLKYLPKTY